MNYQTVSSDKSGLGYKMLGILKNIFISYAITFIMLLIFAFVITYADVSGSVVSPVVVVITLISIILAGALNGRKATEKGWLTGSVSGLLYMLILYFFGNILFHDFSINSHAVMMITAGVLSGILGGIIGINNRPKYKR